MINYFLFCNYMKVMLFYYYFYLEKDARIVEILDSFNLSNIHTSTQSGRLLFVSTLLVGNLIGIFVFLRVLLMWIVTCEYGDSWGVQETSCEFETKGHFILYLKLWEGLTFQSRVVNLIRLTNTFLGLPFNTLPYFVVLSRFYPWI